MNIARTKISSAARWGRLFLALMAMGSLDVLVAQTNSFPQIVNTQNPKDAPLSAEDALKKISVPPGFNVSLSAADPDVQQPIGMAMDPRGRLWVAEGFTYDGKSREFDAAQRDRIIVLEDTQHTGRFDKRTVFWEGGIRLTSVEVGFGGVWALCSSNLVFIPDRDGNEVPDGEPIVLLDGWHACGHTVANGLRWGPDGWLYGRQGIQCTSRIGQPGTPDRERVSISCGIWRYHPTRKVFEVVAQGTTNPWGFDYDDHGQMFFINTVIGHLWHVIPGAHYRRMYGEDANPHTYALIDQHADHVHWDAVESWTDVRRGVTQTTSEAGGGHAHSGLMIYLGNNWPDQYRNALFTINFHGRRFNHDILERSGSGYVGRHGKDFFQSDDEWFRGIDLIYGPDGGVLVSDWSDLGECHDSDGVHRTSGRIYKITHGKPQMRPIADVAKLSDAKLVVLQLEKNDWYVRQARRILQERAADGHDMKAVHAQLLNLFENQKDVTGQLRAMWALFVTGGAAKPWLVQQLSHPSEHARTWAIRFLTDAGAPSADVLAQFVRMARKDDSALVRLFLASTLQRLQPGNRIPLAAALLARAEDASDHNLPLMLWYGIEPITAVAPLEAVNLAKASRIPLVREFMARRFGEEFSTNAAPSIALLEAAVNDPSDGFAGDIIRGLSGTLRGWNTAKPPEAWISLRSQLAKNSNGDLRQNGRKLGLAFGDSNAADEFRVIALDDAAHAGSRTNAVRTLIDYRVPNLQPMLLQLLTNNVTALVAAQGLMAYDDPSIARQILARHPHFLPGEQAQVIGALIARPAAAEILLDEMEAGRMGRQVLSPFHARQIRTLQNEKLNRKLAQVWGEIRNTAPDKLQLIKTHGTALTPERLKKADLPKGRELFNLACATCHTLFGEGAKIGPDLTGSGRANLDYLLENLIDPSAIVGADFRMSVLTLKDGRVLNGIFGPKTDRTVTFQTPGERITIDGSEIVRTEDSAVSLMPEGLLESFNADQIRDLIAYLMSAQQVALPGVK